MKLLFRLGFIALFLIFLVGIIAFARGYRIDFKQKSLRPTGILAISSSPRAAKIYINDELKGVTNSNINLPPGKYVIRIKKEGYTSWNKTVSLKGELVFSIDALLFPLNPSLSPLTNLGIVKAVPLDQTERILLFSENGVEEKDGIYLFEAGKKTLSILPPLTNIIFKKNIPNYELIDFANSNVYFSPDYSQAIVEFDLKSIEEYLEEDPQIVSYLLSLEEENLNPLETSTSKEALIEAWEKEREKDTHKLLETFPKNITKIATDSFKIISFSPDETKFLYTAKKDLVLPLAIKPPLIATNQTKEERNLSKESIYIYDKKEDKNFKIKDSKLEHENSILWYPDSKHIVTYDNKKLAVVDYDKTNKQIVYSGPFKDSFFTVTNSEKIIVLVNLNPENNKHPDLYLVGIR